MLPDLYCPECGTGLDVYSDDTEGEWGEEKVGICPKCEVHLTLEKSVSTTYYARRGSLDHASM